MSAVILSSPWELCSPLPHLSLNSCRIFEATWYSQDSCNLKRIWQHWSNLHAYRKTLREGMLHLQGAGWQWSAQPQPVACRFQMSSWRSPTACILPAVAPLAGILLSPPALTAVTCGAQGLVPHLANGGILRSLTQWPFLPGSRWL